MEKSIAFFLSKIAYTNRKYPATPYIVVAITNSFEITFGLPLETEIRIPIALGISPSQAIMIWGTIVGGSDVALKTVTKIPSITASAKKILCTSSSFVININSEVTIKENTITTSKISIVLKANVIALLLKFNHHIYYKLNFFFSQYFLRNIVNYTDSRIIKVDK